MGEQGAFIEHPLPRFIMTTILIGYDSSHNRTGSCDARCHDAMHDDCECVCGGLNHGVGYKRAVENIVELGLHEYVEDVLLVPKLPMQLAFA